MKNLILLGAPGSGKGTQSAKLVEGMGYKHVSTGNLLREEISKESALGLKVKEIMKTGQLVSDDLVAELLVSNLDLDNCSYIFDGYPRNEDQSKTLDDILRGHKVIAVYLKLDTDILVERLKSRRMTKDGKYIYNLITNPPKTNGVCDVTGEDLIQREDDKEEVVRKRMEVFNNTINPVLDFYSKKGLLFEVDASESLVDIYNKLVETVK